jgi:hypothetical protein
MPTQTLPPRVPDSLDVAIGGPIRLQVRDLVRGMADHFA